MSKRDFEALQNLSKRQDACPSKKPCAVVKRKQLSATDAFRTNDEIHGSIRIEPVMKALIDSPQFQRLRNLKQLGTSNNVYMNANHTRFEHSIGVARLAERVVEGIQRRQPQLPVSTNDVLCIKLAGLLHDLGHGPFSHVFEEFVQDAFPQYYRALSMETKDLYRSFPSRLPKNFGHEQVSLMLIDSALAHLGLAIDLDNLDKPLKEIGGNGIDAQSMRSFERGGTVLTSRDFVFIKECILGKPLPRGGERACEGSNGFIGRSWEKEWMYDVVANRHSGLDVDKMDYFARDSRRSFGQGQVDEVMLEEPVVAWGDSTAPGCEQRCMDRERPHFGKHLMICFPEKHTKAAILFFNTRFNLHSTVYWHKTTRAVVHMICDILCYADPYFRISTAPYVREPGDTSSYPSLPISRAMTDVRAFVRLKDSIIDEIANSTGVNMDSASQLAGRFINRDLYKCAAERTIDSGNPADLELWNMTKEEIKQGLLECGGSHDENGKTFVLGPRDIIIDKFSMHHGQKACNPIDNIRVVPSNLKHKTLGGLHDLPEAERVNLANYKAHTPIEQQQRKIRVYSRDTAKCDLLAHVFFTWLSMAFIESSATPTDGSQEEDGPPPIVSQFTPARTNDGGGDFDNDDDDDEEITFEDSSHCQNDAVCRSLDTQM